MTAPGRTHPRWLAVERLDAATVLRFTRPDIADDDTVRVIGSELLGLAGDPGRHHFVLDFAAVQRLSSATLGMLVAFGKRVRETGGDLALCSLAPWVHLKFERSRLDNLFRICRDEREALHAVPAGRP